MTVASRTLVRKCLNELVILHFGKMVTKLRIELSCEDFDKLVAHVHYWEIEAEFLKFHLDPESRGETTEVLTFQIFFGGVFRVHPTIR